MLDSHSWGSVPCSNWQKGTWGATWNHTYHWHADAHRHLALNWISQGVRQGKILGTFIIGPSCGQPGRATEKEGEACLGSVKGNTDLARGSLVQKNMPIYQMRSTWWELR